MHADKVARMRTKCCPAVHALYYSTPFGSGSAKDKRQIGLAKHKHRAIYSVLSYGEPKDTKHQHSSEVKYAKQQNQQTNYSHIDYRRIDNYQYDSDRCNIFYSEQQVLVY